MSLADWILIGLIGGYCLWLIFRPKKRKCCGDCCQCSGCRK